MGHRVAAAIAVAAGLAIPRPALADRGALTFEVAPALTLFPSLDPPLGKGPGLTGTAGGGLLGVRYGLRNDLELSATVFYELAADYSHHGVRYSTGGLTLPGVLESRASRYGALVGARLVWGRIWRFHLGAEVGWAHQTFENLDLIDVSAPASVHSYGLGLKGRSRDALILTPLVGVEWQVSDRWSVTFTPRLEVMVGGVGRVGLVVPVGVGYSWYLL